MKYIKDYKDAIIAFPCRNPDAAKIATDIGEWYYFLEWLRLHRVPFLDNEMKREQEARKSENVYVPTIHLSIQKYLKCHVVVSTALVEATYLASARITSENKKEVEYAQEILPILMQELDYFEHVLNFYFYSK